MQMTGYSMLVFISGEFLKNLSACLNLVHVNNAANRALRKREMEQGKLSTILVVGKCDLVCENQFQPLISL